MHEIIESQVHHSCLNSTKKPKNRLYSDTALSYINTIVRTAGPSD